MCLYPKLILNKRYCPTKKNGGIIPPCPDNRLKYVAAACGQCYECRKQKQRQWLVRMNEELKNNPNAYFITLTVDDSNMKKLIKECKSKEENDIATYALRMGLERIRKTYGKSVKHWCITELGEDKDRIHIHGIVWGIGSDQKFKEKWKYGIVWVGKYVSSRTINYITKYMLKVDEKHKEFQGKVLCSKGIGANYAKSINARNNKFKGSETNETYRLPNGAKLNLPIYYRNAIYTEEEREALFLSKVEKGIVWICGEKCNIDDERAYMNLLNYHRSRASRLYGDNPTDWDKKKYLKRLKDQRNVHQRAMQRVGAMRRAGAMQTAPCGMSSLFSM